MARQGQKGPRIVCALFLALLAGCAGVPQPEPRSAGAVHRPANQGISWEVVLPGPVLAEVAMWPEAWRPETSRNDARLGVRDDRLATARDEWPQSRPDLARARYLNLPRQSDRMLYFLPERVHRHE
ncbi:MAG: hypothetical protein KF866_08045 [Phycisphaeraceae bacterium]|nr:hypothetical protein [Phycisphaeraceae bacterium]MCW5753827.1 hypothetical protein [Phycisphaeraceae bacterium]